MKKLLTVIAILTLFFVSGSAYYVMIPVPKVIIDIQPFNDMPESEVKALATELSKVYPYVEIKQSVGLPQAAYYTPRSRYIADSLLDFLKTRTPAGHIVIGVTSKDISTPKGSIDNWGIMGKAEKPGTACIISKYRISNNTQLIKLAVHELGHTRGLNHCPVKTCYMRSANGGNPIDQETSFCNSCKATMIKNGWHLK